MNILRPLIRAVQSRWREPQIAFFHEFRRPPYGGSNQFLRALHDEYARRGYRVGANRIGSETKACILNSFAFDVDRLRNERRETCRILHRVDGPISTYRGTELDPDLEVQAINHEFADVTVLQSEYSRKALADLGLQFRNPVVIHNACDPRFFHPKSLSESPGDRVRIICSAWSDHPNKGAASYRWLEAELDWTRYELTFVGQAKGEFRRTRHVSPVGSKRMGELLREHDIYLTASLHESCSNSLIEALACGLPAVYVRSGSNAEVVGQGGLGFEEVEEVPALLEKLSENMTYFAQNIRVRTLSEIGDTYADAAGIPAEYA